MTYEHHIDLQKIDMRKMLSKRLDLAEKLGEHVEVFVKWAAPIKNDYITTREELVYEFIYESKFKHLFIGGAKKAKNPKGFVYLVQSKFGYKIGRTKNLTSRVKLFGVKLPFKIELVDQVLVTDYKSVEKQLHKYFASKHLNGEWFDLSTRDVAEFKQLAQQFDIP